MQLNEMNDIYSGEPQEVQEVREHNPAELATQFIRRKNLPKFELGENEDFYITREQLVKLNETYFQMLDDMREGFSITPQEMRSFMESVVFASYKGEIEKLQRSGKIDGIHKKEVFDTKLSQMTPGWHRRWFQRRARPNYAMSLCLKEAELEAEIENSVYREKIAKQELFLYGSPEDNDEQTEEEYVKANTQEFFEAFVSGLVPKRKRKRFIKKNGEYLNGMLEEFILRQRAMLKLSHKDAEAAEEAEPGESESSDVDPTDEAHTESEQVSDGETVEEDSEEFDYRDYEPEADDLEALYELEEADEEGEPEEEESGQNKPEESSDAATAPEDPEPGEEEGSTSEAEQNVQEEEPEQLLLDLESEVKANSDELQEK